jgi:glycosyltransferase involved in cell wall biosynthesis
MINEGIPKEKIWYRPNAVDIENFKPAGTKDSHEILNVLFCGRLERQKATDILVRAWRLLPDSVSKKARLILAGSGRWEQELRKEAGDMENILFIGTVKRENILEQYQQADIYVHPSRFEGMSNAMLEALACGLPIVATAIDGSTDLVFPDKNGLLVPPEDPAALASALERLITSPSMRETLGKQSRILAETIFSLKLLTEDYAKEYTKLTLGNKVTSSISDSAI